MYAVSQREEVTPRRFLFRKPNLELALLVMPFMWWSKWREVWSLIPRYSAVSTDSRTTLFNS